MLDASALLAILNDEPGAEKLTVAVLGEAVISAVNLAEAYGKLVEYGITASDAWEAVNSPVGEVKEFTREQAKIAGSLISQTRPLGLSLGDRACLALAIALNAPVYTADTAWKNLKLGIRIHLIR